MKKKPPKKFKASESVLKQNRSTQTRIMLEVMADRIKEQSHLHSGRIFLALNRLVERIGKEAGRP